MYAVVLDTLNFVRVYSVEVEKKLVTHQMNYLRELVNVPVYTVGNFHYGPFLCSVYFCFLFVGLCEHPGSSGYVFSEFLLIWSVNSSTNSIA